MFIELTDENGIEIIFNALKIDSVIRCAEMYGDDQAPANCNICILFEDGVTFYAQETFEELKKMLERSGNSVASKYYRYNHERVEREEREERLR